MSLHKKFSFWAALVVAQFFSSNASAYTVETLLSSGDPSNRIDLVIMGDGYRSQDQAKMTTDATNFVNELSNHQLYASYLDYFNIKLVHVISNEAGADRLISGIDKDTALGTGFGLANIDRLMTKDTTAVLNVAMDHTPEYDQILVLANDSKYGGAGGNIAVASTHYLSADIAIHEIGHALFDLGDEYPSSYSVVANSPNLSSSYIHDELPWTDWVTYGTPLPTPSGSSFANFVGAFEFTSRPGNYRPVDNACKMNQLSQDFCSVCQEASILGIYQNVELIDQALPASSTVAVSLSSGSDPTFDIQGPVPDPNTLLFVWYYDGFVLGASSVGSAVMPRYYLHEGMHWLGVVVYDQTDMVRNDEEDIMVDSHLWYLDVTP